MSYKGVAKLASTIRTELGVGYILDGRTANTHFGDTTKNNSLLVWQNYKGGNVLMNTFKGYNATSYWNMTLNATLYSREQLEYDAKVYNMLITTLFLVFLLSTVSLLIFLLMRRPTCFPCCKDSFDIPSNNDEGSTIRQEGSTTYLTESTGGGMKKRLSDSPPPYESPPDYYSLPQEVLVNARGLRGTESGPERFQVGTHTSDPEHPPFSSPPSFSRVNPPVPARRGPKMRGFGAPTSSSSSPLLSLSGKIPPPTPSPSPPSASPPLCAAGGVLGGLASSCRLPAHYAGSRVPRVPAPPSYECAMLQTGHARTLSAPSKPC